MDRLGQHGLQDQRRSVYLVLGFWLATLLYVLANIEQILSENSGVACDMTNNMYMPEKF